MTGDRDDPRVPEFGRDYLVDDAPGRCTCLEDPGELCVVHGIPVSDVLPASCWNCNADSEPRPMGELPPEGWVKRDFTDHVGHGYLCPTCAKSPELLTAERPEVTG